MRELKKNLRKQLIAQRRDMNIAHKNAADIDIFEQLKPFLENSSAVFTYASTEIEVDTRRLIEYCLNNEIPVALPRSGDEELNFFFIKGKGDLCPGRFGIDEPKSECESATSDKSTLCIVPALCADGKGYRLGYGRGYYDRFLKRFDGLSVILCYSDFMCEVPVEPHDVKAKQTIFDRILPR